MLIQVRGTSGSGKTWVMKKFMTYYDWTSHYVEGRKKPLYYSTHPNPEFSVAVLGHYESPCGGCDTIGACPKIFALIEELEDYDVIVAEGLLLSEDTKWTSSYNDRQVQCVFLRTDIELCVRQIKSRRALVGNTKPLNETNTRNRIKVIERARQKLKTSDHVKTWYVPSDSAPKLIHHWIEKNAK